MDIPQFLLSFYREQHKLLDVKKYLDSTALIGCNKCRAIRHKTYLEFKAAGKLEKVTRDKDGKIKVEKIHRWQVCSKHRRCVALQHLAHQPKTNPNGFELDPNATPEFLPFFDKEERERAETNDGSLEHTMNQLGMNRYDKDNSHDWKTCSDPSHTHCLSRQDENRAFWANHNWQECRNPNHKVCKQKQKSYKVTPRPEMSRVQLASILPMLRRARAACEDKGQATPAS